MRPKRHVLAAVLALFVAGCSAAATPAQSDPPASALAPSDPPVSAPAETPSEPPAVPPSPSELGAREIKCDLGGHDGAYHIHSLVGVKVDGQLYAPPANIGIGQTCMYWVHTHDTDGIVHVESPVRITPTLGDFLDLWESTYPDDQLLVAAREAVAAGQVTVDDAPYDGNALDLALADKLRIILGG
jgi:hypothetical protein